MSVLVRMLIVVAAFAVAAAVARRLSARGGPPSILGDLWVNLARTVAGREGLFYAGAIGLTALMVVTGVDRTLQDVFQAYEIVPRNVARAMLHYGEFWTLIAATLVYGVARLRRDAALRGYVIGAVVGRAVRRQTAP